MRSTVTIVSQNVRSVNGNRSVWIIPPLILTGGNVEAGKYSPGKSELGNESKREAERKIMDDGKSADKIKKW